MALAKSVGEGFLRFKYSKKEFGSEQIDRIVFLQYYPPLDRSGAFVEDIEQPVQQKIISCLSNRVFDKEHTMPFVSNADGVRLVHPVKSEWVGEADIKKTDAKLGGYYLKRIKSSVKIWWKF